LGREDRAPGRPQPESRVVLAEARGEMGRGRSAPRDRDRGGGTTSRGEPAARRRRLRGRALVGDVRDTRAYGGCGARLASPYVTFEARPFRSLSNATTASTNGAGSSRTGSTTGKPVSSFARSIAARASRSLRSDVLSDTPIVFEGRSGSAIASCSRITVDN